MKQARTAIFKTLRLLTLVGASLATAAYADEYGDVSQLLRANKFPEAMAKADSYLATKPADPQMRFLKGVIQRNLGKQAEAIATFTKLTEDYPELPEPYNNLAVLYAGQGQYDKARVALEMAIRTNPTYATAHENMGDVYARLASQAYNKALQLDGGNAAVPPKLALIREVFKPNLSNPKPGTSAAVIAAAASPTVAPPVTPAVSAQSAKPAPVASSAKPAPLASAAKPPSPVVSTAANTNKPTPTPAADTNTAKEVEEAVQNWAQAWSDKNMSGYLKAYSPQFTPSGKQSHSAWEKDRHERIMGKSHISVKLSELKIEVNGDKAVAKFRQAYKADSLSVSSHKTLDLSKVNSHWLITRESTGN
jgi:tetratricopeptide (TPR) repeat protein